jgi:hypothetical protein
MLSSYTNQSSWRSVVLAGVTKVRSGSKRATLTVRRSLPVLHGKQTCLGPFSMSQRCQQETHALHNFEKFRLLFRLIEPRMETSP